jgi:hypothetical protein
MTKAAAAKSLVAQLRKRTDQEKARREADALALKLAHEEARKKQETAKRAEQKRLAAVAEALRLEEQEALAQRRNDRALYSKILRNAIALAMKGHDLAYLSAWKLDLPDRQSTFWHHFVERGFVVEFDEDAIGSRAVILYWVRPRSIAVSSDKGRSTVWIGAEEMLEFTNWSDTFNRAMKAIADSGSNVMTLSMASDRTIIIKETRDQLTTANIGLRVLARAFRSLGFKVGIQLSADVDSGDDNFAVDNSDELVVRW